MVIQECSKSNSALKNLNNTYHCTVTFWTPCVCYIFFKT